MDHLYQLVENKKYTKQCMRLTYPYAMFSIFYVVYSYSISFVLKINMGFPVMSDSETVISISRFLRIDTISLLLSKVNHLIV